jgi:5-methylcytosine-specific restriction endonuclease McrA
MKTCSTCQQEKPDTRFRGHRKQCRDCEAAYQRKRWQNDPDKVTASNKKSYAKYQVKRRANRRLYYKIHRQQSIEYSKNYDLMHPEARKRYEAAHPKRQRDYRIANPAMYHAQKKRRLATERGAPIRDLTAQQWQNIQTAQRHCCWYCGRRCKGHLTQDHITPLSKGGSHTLHNVIGACQSCNSKKRSGPPLKPVQPLLL